jgi:hypothetical protein
MVGQSNNPWPMFACRVAGLDLARRRARAHPGRLNVSAALRLPQAPLREQFALIAPHLVGLDVLVFDQSGLGDVAAELLPKTLPHISLPRRRRSTAYLLGSRRPPDRRQVVADPAARLCCRGACARPRSVAFLAAFHVARIPSRSPLTCDDTKGRRFSTPKIKAAEAAKGAQKRARTSRACGELYVLRLVGPVASPPHQFANASGLTRGLEKAALCHAGFKASLGLGWAHAQHSISRTYAPQPSSSASSRRRSALLGPAEKAVPSAGERAGSRSS